MRSLRIWLIGMVAYGAGLVPSAAARGVGWSARRLGALHVALTHTEDVEAALQSDIAAARDPLPAARALDYKTWHTA